MKRKKMMMMPTRKEKKMRKKKKMKIEKMKKKKIHRPVFPLYAMPDCSVGRTVFASQHPVGVMLGTYCLVCDSNVVCHTCISSSADIGMGVH